MVYLRGVLGKRRNYTKSTSDKPYVLDQIKSSDVPISTRYIWNFESRKKRKLLLEVEDELWVSVKKHKNIQK